MAGQAFGRRSAFVKVASVRFEAAQGVEPDDAGRRVLGGEPQRSLPADRGFEARGVDDFPRMSGPPGSQLVPVSGEQRLDYDGAGPIDAARSQERFVEGDFVVAERGVARMADGQGLFDEFHARLIARELHPAAGGLQVERAVGVEAQPACERRQDT